MNMNKEEFNIAASQLSKASLSHSQKEDMLRHIYAAAVTEDAPTPSPWTVYFSFSPKYAAVFALLLMLVSGTTYVSAHSLPGDALYNLKVKFIEPVALSARWHEESRIAYKVSLLQKRVTELQKLKAAGRIDLDSTYASYAAAQHNVTDIEETAAATANGPETVRAAAYVETYNALVEEEFKLRTTLQATREDTATTSIKIDVEMEIGGPAAAEIVEPVVDPVTTAVAEVISVAKPVTPIVEEVTKPLENVVNPVLKGGLGL